MVTPCWSERDAVFCFRGDGNEIRVARGFLIDTNWRIWNFERKKNVKFCDSKSIAVIVFMWTAIAGNSRPFFRELLVSKSNKYIHNLSLGAIFGYRLLEKSALWKRSGFSYSSRKKQNVAQNFEAEIFLQVFGIFLHTIFKRSWGSVILTAKFGSEISRKFRRRNSERRMYNYKHSYQFCVKKKFGANFSSIVN